MYERQRERSRRRKKERLLLFLCAISVIILICVAAILVLQIQSRANEPQIDDYSEGIENTEDSTVNPSLNQEDENDLLVSSENESSLLQGIMGSIGYSSDYNATDASYSAENEDWRLILVNADNPIPDGFQPNLVTLDNGERVDERILQPLNEMMAAARSQGIVLQVNSGYRSFAEQQILFDNTLSYWLATGLSYEQALFETSRYLATPGTSEHHLGLAVDISEVSSWAWLHENSADFGFILRYPMGSEEITGFAYEPWHFRYVGVENAREIRSRGITLEEFLQ